LIEHVAEAVEGGEVGGGEIDIGSPPI